MQHVPFIDNPTLGIRRFIACEGDDIHIVTQQDVSAIVEDNKRELNDAENHWRGTMHKVASIPLSVYYGLMERGYVDQAGNVIDHDEVEKWLTKFLNDSDNRAFRTKPGSI